MHRHASSPLLASVSRSLKEPVLHARTAPDVAPKRSASSSTTTEALWSSSSSSAPTASRKAKEPTFDPTKIVERLVKRHSDDLLGKWKQTPSLRGEEMRLKRTILLNTAKRVSPSKEQQSFLGQEDGEGDELASHLHLAPGSFVEARRNDVATLGIFLGKLYDHGRLWFATMMSNGEVWIHRPADVTFIIPSYISINLAERCGKGALPEDDKQLQARMEALKQLRVLIRDLEEKYSHMWRNKPDVYAQICSPDPDAWGETSVTEVINMLETNPRYQGVYATHRHLMSQSIHYVARDPYMISQTFDVRPRNDVKEIARVMEWKRIHEGPLQEFARRARLILEANESRLKKLAKEPPSENQTRDIWTANDKVILSFLLKSLRPHRSMQADPYALAQIAIMRLLYPKLPRFEESHVHDTLIKLGVISPWQDLLVLQKTFIPDSEPNPKSPKALKDEQLAQRSLSAKPAEGPLGPEDFYRSDPLESVRHDFGELKAFVIDDASAKELDDAVSVERIPNEPGRYWVHAHVANPTAVLPPTHVFAQRAMKEGIAQYLIHRSIPLFPEVLTHHPEAGWSLGSTLKTGKPLRVMTFSAKVDDKGRILEHRVRAGLVKNFRVVTYNAVDKVLCNEGQNYTYPFGGIKKENFADTAGFTEDERQDLLLLQRIAKALQRQRLDFGSISMTSYISDIKIGEFPPGSMTPNLKLKEFQGFPEFTEYSVYRSDITEYGAHGLVAEVMKLASRVASRYAQDNNLPTIRRTVDPVHFPDESKRQMALSMRTPVSTVPDYLLMTLGASTPSADYSLEPKGHHTLAVPEGEGYSRVTSPLRRALDLVTHWQFHDALLGTRRGPFSKPMFTKEWMEDFKSSYATAEKQRKAIAKTHMQFWRGMFLKKWLAGELRGLGAGTPVPDHFAGYVTGCGRHERSGAQVASDVNVPELGLAAIVTTKAKATPRVGEEVRLKVSEIDLGVRPRVTFVLA